MKEGNTQRTESQQTEFVHPRIKFHKENNTKVSRFSIQISQRKQHQKFKVPATTKMSELIFGIDSREGGGVHSPSNTALCFFPCCFNGLLP